MSERSKSAEAAVEEKLYDFICRGGGDGETIKEFAREIVLIARNNKEEEMADKLTPKQAAQQLMLENMTASYNALVAGETDHAAGYAKKMARFVAKDHNKLLKRSNLDGTELSEEP